MAHVQITIAGRAYRMACSEGEEAHLEALAASLDTKIQEMRAAFGEIGDMRLHVMAALMVADDLSEASRRVATLEHELAEVRAAVAAEAERAEKSERRWAEALVEAAERVELLTKSMASAQTSS